MALLLAIFLLASAISIKAANFSCPFSTQKSPCNCTGPDLSSTTFSNAQCRTTSTDQPFEGTEGKYTIDGELDISLNPYNIRSRTFAAFKSIKTLGLMQSNTAQLMKVQCHGSEILTIVRKIWPV